MAPKHTIAHNSTFGATALKSALVDLGLDALARGDVGMVQVLTVIIQRKELRHA